MDVRKFIRKILFEITTSQEAGRYDTVAFPIAKRSFHTFSNEGTNAGIVIDELLGKSEMEAEKMCKNDGLECRTVERDGETFSVTMDLNPNRVNMTINQGIVTKAELY
jgi:hypothetical protein